MNKKDSFLIIILLICALGLLLFLGLAEFPQRTFLWRAIFNAGHAPLFGILSLIMLGLSRLILGPRISENYLHYLIAFVAVTLVGAVTEYIQVFGPRDADFYDILRNIVGAVSFLSIYMSFDVGIAKISSKYRHKTVILLRLLGTALLLAVFIPVFFWSAAYLYRSNSFPQICGFESRWERMFWETKSVELKLTSPPEGWQKAVGQHVARLTFGIDEYPEFRICEPYPDWSQYENLIFEVYSKLDSVVNLNLRIEDAFHDQSYADRFNQTVTVSPGNNQIVVSLAQVREAPILRKMDMTAIESFSIFAYKPENSFTVFVDNFGLRGQEDH